MTWRLGAPSFHTIARMACDVAVLFCACCPLPQGASVDLTWKAWRWDQEPTLKWELRRVFPSMGYIAHSRHSQFHCQARELFPHIRSWLEICGLASREHVGKSRHALVQRREDIGAIDSAEENFWISSAGLVATIARLYHHRRSLDAKGQIAGVATHILGILVDRYAVLAMPWHDVLPEHTSRCSVAPVREDRCACLLAWLEEGHVVVRTAPACSVWRLLSSLAKATHCHALQLHFGRLASVLADAIDGNVQSWGRQDLARQEGVDMMGLSGRKRRRTDPHVRALAGCAAAGSADASRLRALGATQGEQLARAHERNLCEMQAANHLTFARPGVMASAFDAARIGMPSVDMMLHLVWCSATQRLACLPPAAPPFDKRLGLVVMRQNRCFWTVTLLATVKTVSFKVADSIEDSGPKKRPPTVKI